MASRQPALLMCLVCVLFGLCQSRPAGNESAVYPCPPIAACKNDSESVFAIYKNESYCCHAGAAIIFSISGVDFRYTKTFYSHIENTTDNGGDIVKRSAETPGKDEENRKLTHKCVCKPVNNSALDLDFYWLSVTSLTNAVDEAFNEVNNALDEIIGDDSEEISS